MFKRGFSSLIQQPQDYIAWAKQRCFFSYAQDSFLYQAELSCFILLVGLYLHVQQVSRWIMPPFYQLCCCCVEIEAYDAQQETGIWHIINPVNA